MSLDFYGCDAHWSYHGFNLFRAKLASEIGIDLDKMDGFNEDNPEYRGLPWKNILDPIKPLLDHSDCDGELSPQECRTVAPRLLELISEWPDANYDKQQALLLAAGMKRCAKKNKPLVFC